MNIAFINSDLFNNNAVFVKSEFLIWRSVKNQWEKPRNLDVFSGRPGPPIQNTRTSGKGSGENPGKKCFFPLVDSAETYK